MRKVPHYLTFLRHRAPLACIFGFALFGQVALAQEADPAATPFRPTVTSGANLSAPGWLEAEFGGQKQGGRDTDRRDSLPFLLKYSLNDQIAILVGGDAHVRLSLPGAVTLSGLGDTTLTLKYRAPDQWQGVTLGTEVSVKLPTAVDGVGSGKRDFSLKGIYGVDLPAGFHLDTNLVGTRMGQNVAGLSKNQWGWAGAVSHALGESWTLAADLSGTRQSGAPSTRQLLGAASYAVTRRIVIDGGYAAGLNKNTPKYTLFAGVTVLIGRLN